MVKEMLGGCCVCADENGWAGNPLVYCDGPGCEVAVHQGCYGILEVPEGEWLCAKCSASSSSALSSQPSFNLGPDSNGKANGARPARLAVRCELCPSGYGALKRTDKNGWVHVICALYIPEVRFGDVYSMDPVILSDVPMERYEKTCYLCEEEGADPRRAATGACMNCNRGGCKRGFHVTCAQQRGLLCEESSGLGPSKNVKYCGYCHHHVKKAAADPLIKVVPPCRVRPLRTPPRDEPPPAARLHRSTAMLDTLPRPVTEHSSVLGAAAVLDASSSSFSPPLTASSGRSSSTAGVPTPPPPPSSSSLLVPLSTAPRPPPSSSLNTLVSAAMNQAGELTNNNRIAPPPPPSHAALSLAVATNGVKTEVKEDTKSPKANSVKRVRDPKEPKDGSLPKKPKNATLRPSKSVKALLDLVGPVVSETVADFQRERMAAAAAPAQAAAAAAMSTTSLHAQPSTSSGPTSSSHAADHSHASNHVNNSPSTSAFHHSATPSTSGVARPSYLPRFSSEHTPTNPASSGSGGSGSGGGGGTNLPASMDALLERQWEQGSQFLMTNAHFDVAQLLSCLHQLKSENQRLEDSMSSLTKRRDHLLALTARLGVSLAASSTAAPSNHAPPPPPQQAIASSSAVYQPPASLASPHESPKGAPLAVTLPNGSSDDSLSQLRSLAAGTSSPHSRNAPRPSSGFAPPNSAAFTNRPTSNREAALPSTSSSTPTPRQPESSISPERLAMAGGLLGQFRGGQQSLNTAGLTDPLFAQLLLQQQYMASPAASLLARFMLPQIGTSSQPTVTQSQPPPPPQQISGK